jgi:hypothetical protein
MDENQRSITVLVDKQARNIYLYLHNRDKEIYEEKEFLTRSTKTGTSFFEFIQNEGASLFTPSAWINIEMF